MRGLIAECHRVLTEAGIACSDLSNDQDDRFTLIFEGQTVLGFVHAYPDAATLKKRWVEDDKSRIAEFQFALRSARVKAWNTYTVLLAATPPEYADQVALSAIEEDLTGTRKIARAGVSDPSQLEAALLPLLPIQNAPRLDAVDMRAEIALRTSELPDRSVEAFLSNASIAAVVQTLEEQQ